MPCKKKNEKYKSNCGKGKRPLISKDGLHDLHILIFFLAVFHVVYSALTMYLGQLKIRGWKVWEQETASNDYEFANDASRFRLVHETSFVRAHTSFWTRIPFMFTIGCFFRQFFQSVTKSDYLTLRNGFINVHFAPGSNFDFQKYIKRSLEDDFKEVVGVSPVLWVSFVLFLLINVEGSKALFWVSFIPLVIILAVGTKLQAILAQMAAEITERHAVVQGIPLVQGSDKYFWFGRPKLVFYLIHFSLFQMGSHMKRSIFDEQTSRAIMNWQKAAKKHAERAGGSTTQEGRRGGSTMYGGRTEGYVVRSLDDANPISQVALTSMSNMAHSSTATLHRFKTTGHSSYDEYKMSDMEVDPGAESATARLIVRVDNGDNEVATTELQPREQVQDIVDFTFGTPASPHES
ncbi:hypothetical protein AgCh_009273 [Apium graveolens]